MMAGDGHGQRRLPLGVGPDEGGGEAPEEVPLRVGRHPLQVMLVGAFADHFPGRGGGEAPGGEQDGDETGEPGGHGGILRRGMEQVPLHGASMRSRRMASNQILPDEPFCPAVDREGREIGGDGQLDADPAPVEGAFGGRAGGVRGLVGLDGEAQDRHLPGDVAGHDPFALDPGAQAPAAALGEALGGEALLPEAVVPVPALDLGRHAPVADGIGHEPAAGRSAPMETGGLAGQGDAGAQGEGAVGARLEGSVAEQVRRRNPRLAGAAGAGLERGRRRRA